MMHCTFSGVMTLAGLTPREEHADRYACTWEECAGHGDVYFAYEVMLGMRPTCPECCVHLDAALELT